MTIAGTDSLADDGIDTLSVDLPEGQWVDLGGTYSLVLLMANQAGTAVDSVQIGIDTGANNSIWTEVYSVANDGSNLAGAEQKVITLTSFGRYLRFRIQNVSGDTLTTSIKVIMPTTF